MQLFIFVVLPQNYTSLLNFLSKEMVIQTTAAIPACSITQISIIQYATQVQDIPSLDIFCTEFTQDKFNSINKILLRNQLIINSYLKTHEASG